MYLEKVKQIRKRNKKLTNERVSLFERCHRYKSTLLISTAKIVSVCQLNS